MTRKMKKLSANIILDFVAFLAMSAAYLIGRAITGSSKDRDGMI